MKELEVLGQEDVRNLGRSLLNDNATVKLRLGGYSMYPSLIPGDVAIIQKVESDKLKPGQVIVFEQRDRWIAHRIIRISREQSLVIQTQGDSVPKKDNPIHENDILGAVIEIERADIRIRLSPSVTNWFVLFSPLAQYVSRLILKITNRVSRIASPSA